MVRRLAAILFLLGFTLTLLPKSTSATTGPFVEGNCEISFEGLRTQRIQFNARTAPNGETTGEVTFGDVNQKTKPQGDGDSREALFLKAQVECLFVRDNKAVITSTVTEASAERYVGGRLIIVAVVDHNDSNSLSPGKVTWGFYKKGTRDWLATDSERDADEVSPLAWVASDFERPEDEGVVATSTRDLTVSCSTFPMSALSFNEQYHATGNIRLST